MKDPAYRVPGSRGVTGKGETGLEDKSRVNLDGTNSPDPVVPDVNRTREFRSPFPTGVSGPPVRAPVGRPHYRGRGPEGLSTSLWRPLPVFVHPSRVDTRTWWVSTDSTSRDRGQGETSATGELDLKLWAEGRGGSGSLFVGTAEREW